MVEVEPGEPTTVAEVKIDFEGDIAQSPDPQAASQREAIRSGWRLPAGQRFTQEGWDDAKAQAARQLVARRYPAGRISYSLADIDAAAGRAGLGLRIDSGPVFQLGAMEVTGSSSTPAWCPAAACRPQHHAHHDPAPLRLPAAYYDSALIYVDGQRSAGARCRQRAEAPLHRCAGVGLPRQLSARFHLIPHHRVPERLRAITSAAVSARAFAKPSRPSDEGDALGALARVERLDDDVLIPTGGAGGRAKAATIDRRLPALRAAR